MAWNANLTNLRDILADLYWEKAQARRVAQQAGLNVSLIAFGDTPVTTWHAILNDAMLRSKVDNVVQVARSEYPDHTLLALAQDNALSGVRGVDIASKVQWKSSSDEGVLEQIMGKQSTLLPIAFLQIGLERARSVARIRLPDGASGSGFLIANNLLITNNHVLASNTVAAQAKVQFNFQQSALGLDMPVTEYALAPAKGFATSSADDWTAVRLDGDVNAEWGALSLQKASPQKDDFTMIVQHPAGGPKQIALYHNVITAVDEGRVQYLTDTLPGSSGSPVFNMDWQVVALHHSGGWLREPGTKATVYRNEGIHINKVIDGLTTAGLMS